MALVDTTVSSSLGAVDRLKLLSGMSVTVVG
jgi:hypothetical protein